MSYNLIKELPPEEVKPGDLITFKGLDGRVDVGVVNKNIDDKWFMVHWEEVGKEETSYDSESMTFYRTKSYEGIVEPEGGGGV
jgi:hypothetical protein